MYRLTRLYDSTVQTATNTIDSVVHSAKSGIIQVLSSLNLIEGADVSSPSSDLSGNNVVDLSGSTAQFAINYVDSVMSGTVVTVIRYSWTIIALLMAVIVANDLIQWPAAIRLLGFCAVFFCMNINPLLFISVIGYYILRAFKNVYFNYTLSSRKGITPQEILKEQKFLIPPIYGFLPLVTWRGYSGVYYILELLLILIKYKPLGKSAEKTSKNWYYTRDMDEHNSYLKKLVPGFEALLKNPLFDVSDLLAKYNEYSSKLNYLAPLATAIISSGTTPTASAAERKEPLLMPNPIGRGASASPVQPSINTVASSSLQQPTIAVRSAVTRRNPPSPATPNTTAQETNPRDNGGYGAWRNGATSSTQDGSRFI